MNKTYTFNRQVMRTTAILLLCMLCLTMVPLGTYAALARPGASAIPLKSLIIGSYIIDFAAVSPTNVETAVKSVESTGQDQMYYRSELTTGGVMD